jgi:probable HAF family extracellular repeat protein
MKLRYLPILVSGLICLAPHSFAQAYLVTDLDWNGSTPGGGAPHSFINNVGQVAGSGNYNSYGVAHGYLWSGGVPTDIGSLGQYPTTPYGINVNGAVVGQSMTFSGASHAFLYSGGQIQDLGTLPGGSTSNAMGINDEGEIVGYSDVSGGVLHSFLYSGGKMKDLGPSIGGLPNQANAVNKSGSIVGNFTTANGLQHAYLYIGKNVTDLGALISGGGVNSYAFRINNSNQVIIFSDIGSFLYSGGQMMSIPSFPGEGLNYALALGMNNEGQVAGYSSYSYQGFLYSAGTTTNLNDLGLPVDVIVAFDINDAGQIVIWGGEEYLLTPTSAACPPAAYSCGCQQDVYKNVPAFYNGSDEGTGKSCASSGIFGSQYQCVEYVNRFYAQAKGIDSLNWHGNGSQYYSKATQFGLSAYPNCTTEPSFPCASNTLPQPDDIVSFCNYDESSQSCTDGPGHASIIKSVSGSGTTYTVTFIEENYSKVIDQTLNVTQNPDLTYTMADRCTKTVKNVCTDWLRAYGWLRPPATN